MAKYWFLFAAVSLFWVACASPPSPTPRLAPPPTAVLISDNSGATLGSQPGPLWVLLSGVDEHGLITEHELALLSAPDPQATPGPHVHTGVAAVVHEIRQTGPQDLRRFYQVQAVTGASGWISDFYVRRVAYLYQSGTNWVSLYDSPGGREILVVANVTPVILKEPTREDWWLVQTVGSHEIGWAPAASVKESSALEFLLNQQHEH